MPVTFEGTPEWYGGTNGVIQNLSNRAHQVTTTPFTPYPNARNAPFTPLQEQSFNTARDEVNNPEYQNLFNRSAGSITNALGQDISGQLTPFIQRGTENPVTNAQQYMNPYNQQVTEEIGRLASRNLNENILPNINDRFIRGGSYGSSGGPGSSSHQDITGRAIRDTQDAVTRAQGEALQSGYNKALETSVGQQERNLQAGRLYGTARGEDLSRNITGGRELQNLNSQQQGERRQGIGLLNQLGGQQQQQAQTGLNTAFADFQAEKNYPYIQAARESELTRGLTPGQYTSQTATYMPQPPQASPWSQGAGLLAGLTGAVNQRPGFAHGGEVHEKVSNRLKASVAHLRHYADGGSVPLSPIQMGVNDALDTTEIQAMRKQAQKLKESQVDPFWAAISRGGFNLASNRQPGVLANLGQAGNAGLDEYNKQLETQDNREMGATKINHLIDNTRRYQSEANRKHALDLEKFGHQKDLNNKHLGMQEERLNMERSKFKKSQENENIITGKDGMLYELTKDENGNKIAKPIEGIKSKSSSKLYEKSNEKAIEEARSSLGSIDSLNYNLNELEKVAKNLDTGPVKGKVSKYASTLGDIPIIGSSIAAGASEDVNTFDALTNQLVLDLGNQLKGSQIALGKLKIIEASKPQLEKTREGNLSIISHLKDLADLSKEKANFIIDKVEQGQNAVTAQKAFSEYADAKLEYEEKNPGKKYPNKPEDFLDKDQWEKENGLNQDNSLESMSDEELRKIAGE